MPNVVKDNAPTGVPHDKSEEKQIDQGMVVLANSLGSDPDITLSTIIATLVDVDAERGCFLPDELIQRFRDNIIAENLADDFIYALKKEEETPDARVVESIEAIAGRVTTTLQHYLRSRKEKTAAALRRDVGKAVRSRDLDNIENFRDARTGKKTGEVPAEARTQLKVFLRQYAQNYGDRTIRDFLHGLQEKYPGITVADLFDEEIRHLLIKSINIAAQSIINDKFSQIFERQAADYVDEDAMEHADVYEHDSIETVERRHRKQRRQRFICKYLFTRCIGAEAGGKISIDQKKIKNLVEYLNARSYPVECLYMLIYAELTTEYAMELKVHDRRSETRREVGASGFEIDKSDDGEKSISARMIADYDEFFGTYFIPPILEARRASLSKLHTLRMIDVVDIDPAKMARCVLPKEWLGPIAKLVNEEGDEGAFIRNIREYFHYPASIGDDKIKEEIVHHLNMAATQIDYIVRNALSMRRASDPIIKDCQLVGEILECRDLYKLIQWLIHPEKFVEAHPDYSSDEGGARAEYKIIRHQARKMIEMFLFCRGHAFDEDFQQAEGNRDSVEADLCGTLKIEPKNKQPQKIKYRVAELVDENDKPILTRSKRGVGIPQYEIFMEGSVVMDIGPNNTEIITVEGKRYRFYPIETRDFTSTKAKIPLDNKPGSYYEVELIWYSGDGRLVHCKSQESYFSAILRGKTPTDKVRATVCADESALHALRNLLYRRYLPPHRGCTITDKFEQRRIIDKRHGRTRGSDVYSELRGLHAKCCMDEASIGKDGNITHKYIDFELEAGRLKDILLGLSDYTVSSHRRAYTPEREFRTLFDQLCPPPLHGKKYANYKLDSFNGCPTG